MDNLKSRLRARVVACFGLVVSIVTAFLTIGAVVYHFKYDAVWGGLLYTVLVDNLVAVHLLTSIKLLSATKKGNSAGDALGKSLFWLIVNVVLFVISAVIFAFYNIFENGTEKTFLIKIVINIGFGIYVTMMITIYNFMEELEVVIRSGGSVDNNMDCVYVKKLAQRSLDRK